MQETLCRTCGAMIALHLKDRHERWHFDRDEPVARIVDRRLLRPCERGDHRQCVGQALGADATIYCCDCYCHAGHRGELDKGTPDPPEQPGTCPEAAFHDYQPIAWARRKVRGGFDETVTDLQCRHCLTRLRVSGRAKDGDNDGTR